MREVAKKRDLRKHCRFHTSVDKAEWDANANVWRIEIRDVRTGEKQVTRATALVSAIGVLVVPSFPKLQGIESFKGEVFHSARWDHDVDLHGKRVAVVGNGSSAYVDPFIIWSGVLHVVLILPLRAQFVPKISADPTVSVVNFARTAMWYVPSVSASSQRYIFFPLYLTCQATHSLSWDYKVDFCVHTPRAAHPSAHDLIGGTLSNSRLGMPRFGSNVIRRWKQSTSHSNTRAIISSVGTSQR
jgi:hypothetical protein